MARRLILDAGAISALADFEPRARAALRVARERRMRVAAPAVTVAETTRGSGPKDARVNRVLARLDIPASDEARGRVAGGLLARPGAGGKTIDALIVAEALSGPGGADILTADPEDMRLLADGHPSVRVRALRENR
ncbi:MAG: hypothetical protein ACRDIU_01115 [Actinomycetota bacterium]